jgi:hypothetical protein
MPDVLKNHGEIGALAFDPLKDGPQGRRIAVARSALDRSESQSKLAAVTLRLSLSTTSC